MDAPGVAEVPMPGPVTTKCDFNTLKILDRRRRTGYI